MNAALFDLSRLPERFWSKVNRVPSNCWIWTGATSGGYGRVAFRGAVRAAHRVAYETLTVRVGVELGVLVAGRAVGLTGYTTYSCRCAACKAANREYKRQYRARAG